MRVITGGKRRPAGRRNYKKRILLVLLSVVVIMASAFIYVLNAYRVQEVSVEGNVHYTDEEIRAMVMEGTFGNNSLFLSLKYRDKEITGIPFIDTMDVVVISPKKIQINVYEKVLAGCINHMGIYIYFDKDGVVVEMSSKATEGVPLVTGLSFEEVLMKHKLPVEDEKIFTTILNLTKLMDKYQVKTDRINFNKNGNVVLYFDKVRVLLGQPDYLEEKIMQLPVILPSLLGKSGELKMEYYKGPAQDITFIQD